MSDFREFGRYAERRRQFQGTDEEYDEWCWDEASKTIPYLMNHTLIAIYKKDKKIGESIHKAYRAAIVGAIEDKENFDALVADLKSSQAELTASENQTLEDDESIKLFSVQAKETADLMVSLLQTNTEKAQRIDDVFEVVLCQTNFSSERSKRSEDDDLEDDDPILRSMRISIGLP